MTCIGVLTDVNIQQATVNLLADMQCHPLTPNLPTLRRVDDALIDKGSGKDKGAEMNNNDITPPTSTLLFPAVSSVIADRKGVPHGAAAITHPLNGPVYVAQVTTQFNSTQPNPTQLNPSIVLILH